MSRHAPYIHVLDGRLRIKLDELRRSPERALRVETKLMRIKGVSEVKANPLTGNVLVLFEGDKISHQHIINHLKQIGYFRSGQKSGAFNGAHDRLSQAVGEMIIKMALEAALNRLVLAMI